MIDINGVEYRQKKDKYSNSRGGNSVFFEVFCSKCNQYILTYQKDGIGNLHRLYLDRIFAPIEFSKLQESVSSKQDIPNLFCSKCNCLIGTPMIYEKENRFAFRLIHGSFIKIKNKRTIKNGPRDL